MKKLKVIVIGAGNRGGTYTDYMTQMPEKYEVVAVAEPRESRREYVQKKHNIPDNMCFDDYKPLLALGKIADIALIATMDRQHFEPAMKAIDLGYDLLLEKPITPTPEECIALTKHANEKGVKVVICTVLRYTFLFNKLKEIIDSGRIGKVMSINHEECVEFVHQSHSFVRGNWHNSEESSFMLLQKSCHDMDILQWLLGKKCKKVQSFGSLSYFTEANAPEGAPARCLDGCPVGETCPYNAVKLYLENESNWFRSAATKLVKSSDEDVKKSLAESNYGKCVFHSNNDVVDHQTVNMLFEDDVTVTFTMNAFNSGGRYINIYGTKGEIRAALKGDCPIKVYDPVTKETEEIPCNATDGILGGHGGGDAGIIVALYDYMTDNYDGCAIPTISESCYNHLITFAAEHARKTGTVVDVDEFINNLQK
ncbi:MAG: Gfo/Idh/MocA family oxidoreductase [Clostridia bacterium]|nr:Gfo/Idh/MocA family oxidoreductase [Clostridia bacterium]